MNLPKKNNQVRGPLDLGLMDRLVDGELPEAERRELLLQLETEPDGWRRCALAFLEAQNWRQALAPLAVPIRSVPQQVVLPSKPCRKRPSWRPLATLTALAAGLFAAFSLGWALHGGPGENVSRESLTQRETPAASSGPSEVSQPGPVSFAAQDSRPLSPEEPATPLDSVVQQWEQRGYHAERQQRLVSMKLQDGRKVEVPVQEVRLKYIGDRTY